MARNVTKNYLINGISGIWNSYGCVPNPGESVSISLEDHGDGTESLKDLCGFDGKAQDIGVLADQKEISELIVLLPMAKKDITAPTTEQEVVVVTGPADPCIDCPDNDPCGDTEQEYVTQHWAQNHKDFIDLYFSITDYAYLFKIKEETVNKILGVPDYKKLTIDTIKEILDHKQNINKNNSIVNLMVSMTKYNFPPHLNWLLFNGSGNNKFIPPIAMYVAEYKHTLSKHDLSNIWQGTMPEIAKTPEEEEIEIEHFLGEEEIFGGYDIDKYDISLRIFKCKKRANNNYNKDVVRDETPTRKQTDLLEQKWYHSNWPYDNFSLVELLKVEMGEIHDNINKPTNGVLIPDPQTPASQWTESVTINSDGSTSTTYASTELTTATNLPEFKAKAATNTLGITKNIKGY
jgi:hypothetical protein